MHYLLIRFTRFIDTPSSMTFIYIFVCLGAFIIHYENTILLCFRPGMYFLEKVTKSAPTFWVLVMLR